MSVDTQKVEKILDVFKELSDRCKEILQGEKKCCKEWRNFTYLDLYKESTEVKYCPICGKKLDE